MNSRQECMEQCLAEVDFECRSVICISPAHLSTQKCFQKFCQPDNIAKKMKVKPIFVIHACVVKASNTSMNLTPVYLPLVECKGDGWVGGVKIRLGGTIPVSANPLPSSTHTNSVPMQNSFAKHITITHCSGFLRGGSTLTVSLTVKIPFFFSTTSRRV